MAKQTGRQLHKAHTYNATTTKTFLCTPTLTKPQTFKYHKMADITLPHRHRTLYSFQGDIFPQFHGTQQGRCPLHQPLPPCYKTGLYAHTQLTISHLHYQHSHQLHMTRCLFSKWFIFQVMFFSFLPSLSLCVQVTKKLIKYHNLWSTSRFLISLKTDERPKQIFVMI